MACDDSSNIRMFWILQETNSYTAWIDFVRFYGKG